MDAIKRQFKQYFRPPESAAFIEVERCERIFYLNYLSEGMTVFDVGANVGELALLFSRFVGESGRIHAFEAASTVFARLQLACEIFSKRNITLNHLALSDINGVIDLHVYDHALSGFNSQAERPLKNYGLDFEPVAIETTPATTVDDYCVTNGIEKIDLLKIDVEGAELQVMRGSRLMMMAKRVECVTFEFGQTTFDMGNSPAEIKDFLEEADYRIRNVVEGDPLFPGGGSVETAKYSMFVATPK